MATRISTTCALILFLVLAILILYKCDISQNPAMGLFLTQVNQPKRPEIANNRCGIMMNTSMGSTNRWPSDDDGGFHKRYPVNCTAIFEGDETEIEKVYFMLKRYTETSIPGYVPSDYEVSAPEHTTTEVDSSFEPQPYYQGKSQIVQPRKAIAVSSLTDFQTEFGKGEVSRLLDIARGFHIIDYGVPLSFT